MTQDRNPYTLQNLGDFVRLDALCHQLLREFVVWLQEEQKLEPAQAGDMAHAADRYLRDFVVDIKETGPADADPTLVRQYLGNWYIIHTLEPTPEEIDHLAVSLLHLQRYLSARGILTPTAAAAAAEHLRETRFYHQRLAEFWELTPDEIAGWRGVDDYRRGRSTG